MLVAKNERSAPYPDGCVQEVAERLRLVGGDASGQAADRGSDTVRAFLPRTGCPAAGAYRP